MYNKERGTNMQTEKKKTGTCGCGRSPTGNCCGWHSLTEARYQEELKKYLEKNREQNKGS